MFLIGCDRVCSVRLILLGVVERAPGRTVALGGPLSGAFGSRTRETRNGGRDAHFGLRIKTRKGVEMIRGWGGYTIAR